MKWKNKKPFILLLFGLLLLVFQPSFKNTYAEEFDAITLSGSYYIVDTSVITLYIFRGDGNDYGTIENLTLNSNPTINLADNGGYDGYNPWYPEYEVGEDLYIPQANNVEITSDEKTWIKCVWYTTRMNITWFYEFYPEKNYFKINETRLVKDKQLYFNSQTCHMFSNTFSTGGYTDYEGNLIVGYVGYPTLGSGTQNVSAFMPVFTYITNNSGNYYPIQWLESSSESMALGVVVTNILEKDYHTFCQQKVTKLTASNEWEFQWDHFGRTDIGAIRLDVDLEYGSTYYFIIVEGDRDTLKIESQALYSTLGGVTHKDETDAYFDVGYGRHNSLIRTRIIVETPYIQTKYVSYIADSTLHKRNIVVPYPRSEMLSNMIFYDFTKDGASLIPLEYAPDSYGNNEGSNWESGWIEESVDGVWHNTTFRVYNSTEDNKKTIYVLGECNSTTGIQANFTLGSGEMSNQTRFSVSEHASNWYRITYDDPLLGNLAFDIKNNENTTITYDNSGKNITVTPTQLTYKFKIELVTIPTPPENSVALNSPSDEATETNYIVDFKFTPVFYQTIQNACLWTNEGGWSSKEWNTTTILNNTENTISETFSSEGAFLWNIRVFNSTYGLFASTNFTVTIYIPTPPPTPPPPPSQSQLVARGTSFQLYFMVNSELAFQHIQIPMIAEPMTITVTVDSGTMNGTAASVTMWYTSGIFRFTSQDTGVLSISTVSEKTVAVKVNGGSYGSPFNISPSNQYTIEWSVAGWDPLMAIMGLCGIGLLIITPTLSIWQIKVKKNYYWIFYSIILFIIAYAFIVMWIA